MRRAAAIASVRARRQSTDSGDYFASMTDLMLGLIFIFIIMLMGFVLNLHEAEHKLTTTVSELTDADLARRELLRDVARLLQNALPVTIDEDNGTLQLGDDVLFPKGSADAYPEALPKLRLIADALDRVLPCYAMDENSRRPFRKCGAEHKGRLDAVYIEGHTDATPIKSAHFQNNWELSAARAAVTFNKLVEYAPALGLLKNDRHEALIGVSGYGEYRPLDPGSSENAMQKNRRIELRFVMVSPDSGRVDQIRDQIGEQRKP
jgi:chemotaxis protein MotB